MKYLVAVLVVICVGCAYSASIPILHKASSSRGIIPPPPGDQCVNPEGGEGGLGGAVRILVDMLPAEDLITVLLIAISENEEVQNAFEYLSGPEFIKIITVMNNKKEYIEILEYFCEELHFDVYYYLNSLGEIMGFPAATRPPQVQGHRQRRNTNNTLKDFFRDLIEVLPLEELKAMYNHLLETDEYLKLAMEKIGSDEFRLIGDAIQAMPEYEELMQRMRDLNIPIDEILDRIMEFFGWCPRK